MLKKIMVIWLGLLLVANKMALAVCPVCTIAVGAGLGLSRWLKIDDTVSGVWIGGLIVSSGLWLADWLRKKKINKKGMEAFIVIATYVLVMAPLWRSEMIGHPYNRLWGVDKLVLGSAVGVAIFGLAQLLNNLLKKKNGNKVYFPYQKVVLPVVLLLAGSLAFYLITNI